MIDFTTVLTNLDGSPIIDGREGAEGKPIELTLSRAAVNALLADYADERGLAGEEKLKRAQLADKVYQKKAVELTAEQTALVKKLIAKAYTPLVVLRAWAALDPTSVSG